MFRTRCHVNEKVCRVVIDEMLHANYASTTLVKKLNLPTLQHPKPYMLPWMNEFGELEISKQVLVPFSIGRYKDEILCDISPMTYCHLSLGRTWQLERGAKHDKITNRYKFVRDNKRIALVPLSEKEVYEEEKRILEVEKDEKEAEEKRKECEKKNEVPVVVESNEENITFELTNNNLSLPIVANFILQDQTIDFIGVEQHGDVKVEQPLVHSILEQTTFRRPFKSLLRHAFNSAPVNSAIPITMAKIRGRIFLKKGGMIRIKWHRLGSTTRVRTSTTRVKNCANKGSNLIRTGSCHNQGTTRGKDYAEKRVKYRRKKARHKHELGRQHVSHGSAKLICGNSSFGAAPRHENSPPRRPSFCFGKILDEACSPRHGICAPRRGCFCFGNAGWEMCAQDEQTRAQVWAEVRAEDQGRARRGMAFGRRGTDLSG